MSEEKLTRIGKNYPSAEMESFFDLTTDLGLTTEVYKTESREKSVFHIEKKCNILQKKEKALLLYAHGGWGVSVTIP